LTVRDIRRNISNMITLIGHGYVGEHIAAELRTQQLPFTWIHHTEHVPICTNWIINAAGYTGNPNVDACESDRDACIAGNVTWPMQLEHENAHTPIIHIHSGCIYSGYPPTGFTETDAPNFTFDTGSFYSGSKALAQQMLMPFMHKSYLFRIRMPFGRTPHRKNLLTKLEHYPKLIECDNSMTSMEDLGRVVCYFIRHKPWCGIYNVCNPGIMSTKQIMDLMGIEKEWFTPEEFRANTLAPRSNCYLNTDKLQRVFALSPISYVMESCVKSYMTQKVTT
jgi:dTDP-4-dehydrorhamnose reductase